MIKVFIENVDYRQNVGFRILDIYENSETIASLQINKKGKFEWVKYLATAEIPFTLEFKNRVSGNIVQELADALGKAGYYPRATNRDKIKAEAIIEEKVTQLKNSEEQISWLRNMIQQHWRKPNEKE